MASSNESVAHAFAAAISRQDVAALAELMTENHRFIDSLGNAVEGREKMRAGWAGYFRMVPDYTIAIDETFTNADPSTPVAGATFAQDDKQRGGAVVVMIGSAQGTYSPDGALHHDQMMTNHWRTPAAFRAVIEDGKVAEWRVYADNEPIRKLMAKR